MNAHICIICSKKYQYVRELYDHLLDHQLEILEEKPLVVIIHLPGDCTHGNVFDNRMSGVAFAKALRRLREQYPNKKFSYLPLAYEPLDPENDEGPDSLLVNILAVESD